MTVLLTGLLILLCASNIASAQWRREHGPNGANVIHLSYSDRMLFAGTQFGGLYASTDLGSSWRLLDGTDDSYAFAAAKSGDTIVAGLTFRGLAVSVNGGKTWRYHPPADMFNISILSTSICSGMLFASIGGTLWRSGTDPKGWENIAEVRRAPIACGSNIIGFTDEPVLSKDTGRTWIRATRPHGFKGCWMSRSYLFDGTLYNVCQSSIYKSLDCGETWVFDRVIEFDGSALDLTEGLSLAWDQMGPAFSHDQFRTFTRDTIGLPYPLSITGCVVADSVLVLATDVGVFVKTASEVGWRYSAEGMDATQITDMTIQNGVFVAVGKQGSYVSRNEGRTWKSTLSNSDRFAV